MKIVQGGSPPAELVTGMLGATTDDDLLAVALGLSEEPWLSAAEAEKAGGGSSTIP